MWLALKKLLKCQRGFTTLSYLLLTLIVGGTALLISAAVSGQLAVTHNDNIQTIQQITGGGF